METEVVRCPRAGMALSEATNLLMWSDRKRDDYDQVSRDLREFQLEGYGEETGAAGPWGQSVRESVEGWHRRQDPGGPPVGQGPEDTDRGTQRQLSANSVPPEDATERVRIKMIPKATPRHPGANRTCGFVCGCPAGDPWPWGGDQPASSGECRQSAGKPTFCGQARKVGNVPEADIQALQFTLRESSYRLTLVPHSS